MLSLVAIAQANIGSGGEVGKPLFGSSVRLRFVDYNDSDRLREANTLRLCECQTAIYLERTPAR